MQQVLVFVALSLIPVVINGHRAVFSIETIKTKEQLNVTLQCRLDPRVNLVHYASFWDRADLLRLVHIYRPRRDGPGPQLLLYRDRITLVHDMRGVLSLHISSVQLCDTGPYRCYVPKLRAGCIINLIVGKRETPITAKPRLDPVTEPDHPEVRREEKKEEEKEEEKEPFL